MKTIISIALASALLAGCADIRHEPISRTYDDDRPSGGTMSASTNKSSSISDRTTTKTRNGTTTTSWNDTLSASSNPNRRGTTEFRTNAKGKVTEHYTGSVKVR